jgi:hypothetical protein
MSLVLGELQVRDVDRLLPLWGAPFRHHTDLQASFELVTPAPGAQAAGEVRRQFYEALLGSGGWITLAEVDGSLAGYAAVSLRAGESGSRLPSDFEAEALAARLRDEGLKVAVFGSEQGASGRVAAQSNWSRS